MSRTVLERKIHNMPLVLITLITILCFYGVLVLYAAAGGNMHPWGYKQLTNFCIFMPIAIIIGITDITRIFRLAHIPYLIVIVLLCIVEIFGYTAMGGKRWIDILGLRLQPSEPTKIAIVLMLSKYFHLMSENDMKRSYKLIIPIALIVLPVIFVIRQPDLGTGLLILMVSAVLFFTAGARPRIFVILGTICAMLAPILWYFLYAYQKKRIMTFLNPELDPLGAGYNIIQSKIAIGSGGMTGKGLTMGTQSQLDFLPEHQTDFIFASLAEEFGFCGTGLLILLYGLVIYISLAIAINARSTFGKLLVIGVISIFFFHVFINIAMVIGLLPAVGLPLPFISYGGTMMASMLCGFGLIINVHVHKNIRL